MSEIDTKLQIVIAHYNEDIMHFRPYQSNCLVYSKADDSSQKQTEGFKTIQLPNFGRDCHTYLLHLVENYENLAEVTLFTQADPFPHLGSLFTVGKMIERALTLSQKPGVIAIDTERLERFSDWNRLAWFDYNELFPWWTHAAGTIDWSNLKPSEFWKRVMQEEDHPEAVMVCRGAIFAVHRETIHRCGKARWQRALDTFDEEKHVNPEIGFIMEILWMAFISDEYIIRKKISSVSGNKDIFTQV